MIKSRRDFLRSFSVGAAAGAAAAGGWETFRPRMQRNQTGPGRAMDSSF